MNTYSTPADKLQHAFSLDDVLIHHVRNLPMLRYYRVSNIIDSTHIELVPIDALRTTQYARIGSIPKVSESAGSHFICWAYHNVALLPGGDEATLTEVDKGSSRNEYLR